ncbi:hypothetical protein OROMI_000877 [Orobanche minor]
MSMKDLCFVQDFLDLRREGITNLGNQIARNNVLIGAREARLQVLAQNRGNTIRRIASFRRKLTRARFRYHNMMDNERAEELSWMVFEIKRELRLFLDEVHMIEARIARKTRLNQLRERTNHIIDTLARYENEVEECDRTIVDALPLVDVAGDRVWIMRKNEVAILNRLNAHHGRPIIGIYRSSMDLLTRDLVDHHADQLGVELHVQEPEEDA